MSFVTQKAIEPEDLFDAVAEALKDPIKQKKLYDLPDEKLTRMFDGCGKMGAFIGAEMTKDLIGSVATALKDPVKRKKLDEYPWPEYNQTMRCLRDVAEFIGADLSREIERTVPVVASVVASKEEMEAAVKKGMSGLLPKGEPRKR
jgi:hypothetical protein